MQSHDLLTLDRECAVNGVGNAHLVGIGGAGMRAIADVLRGRGWRVAGSDAARTDIDDAEVGHRAENVADDVRLVVHSAAVPPENCEVARAAALGATVRSYPQVLGELMQGKRGLAVAGTHGKSTTAAMAANILIKAGFDPTVVIGATPLGCRSGGRAGAGDLVLVEACEYREHFLALHPRVAVMLGIEADHFDHFRSARHLEGAFAQFAAQTAADGLVLANAACCATLRATAGLACRREKFGLAEGADWRAAGIEKAQGRYRFELCHRDRRLGTVRLRVAGLHNVTNALAAAALAKSVGATDQQVIEGLETFGGLKRRLEFASSIGGVTWIDDYAHHPTEVAATLATVRQMYPRARMWTVFQPHQASRTAALLDEFARELQNTDRLIVADVFRAREGAASDGEVTAADLAGRVRDVNNNSSVDVCDGHAPWEIERRLQHAIAVGELAPGDVLITMGAGDIGNLGHGLIRWLDAHRAAG